MIVGSSVLAESLWSSDFKGYLSGARGFVKGDAVVVQIDASSTLSFSATTNDSKSLTMEFSGGDAGGLFSFLPQGKTTDALSAKGAETYTLSAEVAAVVADVDATGRGMIQGSRSVSIDGKTETVTISGWVSPKDVGPQGKIPFSRLADARLVYKTLLIPSEPILTDKDIQQILAQQMPAAGSTGAPTTAPADAAAGTTYTPAAPAQSMALSDAKKKELLLIYLNKLIDILFAQ
jgi:hypothetical protein